MHSAIINNDTIDKFREYSKEFRVYYDPVKNLMDISDSVFNVTGYSANELKKKKPGELLKLIHPEDQSRIQEEYEALDTSSAEDYQFASIFNFKKKSGDFCFLEIRGFIRNTKGSDPGIYCLLRDQTETHQLEAKLEKYQQELERLNEKLRKHDQELEVTHDKLTSSEEIFRQLAENTDDIFWLRDEEEILYINNQFERIWGRKKEELIANPYKIVEWIHPDDITNVEPWINLSSLSTESPLIEQYRIIKPDGEERWLLSKTFPVLDKAGRKYRLVGIISDITEQKEYEEALMIAKEKAQESDMLKSSFLANISHEIRTPMNGIIGFAELITREDIEKEAQESYVAIMKKSSEQLVRIIDDIIDFAKLESNQIRIVKQTLNLNKMLDQLFVLFSNQLKGMEKDFITLLLSKSAGDKDCNVISDEQRLRQVFSQLLDNSCKYTDEGFIEFGYEFQDEQIEFFVKDSGIGIPEEKHAVIFEQFRQGDEGHTRKYGGTGLGLPITRALVNLLGGSIRLESRPDEGTTFYFTVPRIIEKEAETAETKLAHREVEYNWKDKLILVAEDDELNFEFIKIILEPTQAKVVRAKDGSQAVKMCSNLNFDLILMDVRLPVMNGLQATKRLRENDIQTPVIAQTAFAMDDDEKKCLDAGCNYYMAKPIRKEQLFEVINSFFTNK